MDPRLTAMQARQQQQMAAMMQGGQGMGFSGTRMSAMSGDMGSGMPSGMGGMAMQHGGMQSGMQGGFMHGGGMGMPHAGMPHAGMPHAGMQGGMAGGFAGGMPGCMAGGTQQGGMGHGMAGGMAMSGQIGIGMSTGMCVGTNAGMGAGTGMSMGMGHGLPSEQQIAALAAERGMTVEQVKQLIASQENRGSTTAPPQQAQPQHQQRPHEHHHAQQPGNGAQKMAMAPSHFSGSAHSSAGSSAKPAFGSAPGGGLVLETSGTMVSNLASKVSQCKNNNAMSQQLPILREGTKGKCYNIHHLGNLQASVSGTDAAGRVNQVAIARHLLNHMAPDVTRDMFKQRASGSMTSEHHKQVFG